MAESDLHLRVSKLEEKIVILERDLDDIRTRLQREIHANNLANGKAHDHLYQRIAEIDRDLTATAQGVKRRLEIIEERLRSE